MLNEVDVEKALVRESVTLKCSSLSLALALAVAAICILIPPAASAASYTKASLGASWALIKAEAAPGGAPKAVTIGMFRVCYKAPVVVSCLPFQIGGLSIRAEAWKDVLPNTIVTQIWWVLAFAAFGVTLVTAFSFCKCTPPAWVWLSGILTAAVDTAYFVFTGVIYFFFKMRISTKTSYSTSAVPATAIVYVVNVSMLIGVALALFLVRELDDHDRKWRKRKRLMLESQEEEERSLNARLDHLRSMIHGHNRYQGGLPWTVPDAAGRLRQRKAWKRDGADFKNPYEDDDANPDLVDEVAEIAHHRATHEENEEEVKDTVSEADVIVQIVTMDKEANPMKKRNQRSRDKRLNDPALQKARKDRIEKAKQEKVNEMEKMKAIFAGQAQQVQKAVGDGRKWVPPLMGMPMHPKDFMFEAGPLPAIPEDPATLPGHAANEPVRPPLNPPEALKPQPTMPFEPRPPPVAAQNPAERPADGKASPPTAPHPFFARAHELQKQAAGVLPISNMPTRQDIPQLAGMAFGALGKNRDKEPDVKTSSNPAPDGPKERPKLIPVAPSRKLARVAAGFKAAEQSMPAVTALSTAHTAEARKARKTSERSRKRRSQALGAHKQIKNKKGKVAFDVPVKKDDGTGAINMSEVLGAGVGMLGAPQRNKSSAKAAQTPLPPVPVIRPERHVAEILPPVDTKPLYDSHSQAPLHHPRVQMRRPKVVRRIEEAAEQFQEGKAGLEAAQDAVKQFKAALPGPPAETEHEKTKSAEKISSPPLVPRKPLPEKAKSDGVASKRDTQSGAVLTWA